MPDKSPCSTAIPTEFPCLPSNLRPSECKRRKPPTTRVQPLLHKPELAASAQTQTELSGDAVHFILTQSGKDMENLNGTLLLCKHQAQEIAELKKQLAEVSKRKNDNLSRQKLENTNISRVTAVWKAEKGRLED